MGINPVGYNFYSAVPTVTAGAYSAADTVGGLLTFTGAGLHGGVLSAVTIIDRSDQKAQLELVLFKALCTPVADNAAFAFTVADLEHVIGVAVLTTTALAATAYNDYGSISVLTTTGLSLPIPRTDDGNLYGQLVTRSTPTYATTSAIRVSLTVLV
jgi:hypothetical protein